MIRARLLLIGGLIACPAYAAELEPVVERKTGDWAAVLYRNAKNSRLFCAIESHDKETTLRIVRYKDTNNTFLEIINNKWKLIPGQSKFILDVSTRINQNDYDIEFSYAGSRDSNSYSYSFEDADKYMHLLGAISGLKSLSSKNTNNTTFASFGAQGANAALRNYNECLNSDWQQEAAGRESKPGSEGSARTSNADRQPGSDNDQLYLKSKQNGEIIIGNRGASMIPCTLDSRFSDCELDVWTTHFSREPNFGAHMVYFQGDVVFSCYPQRNYIELRAESMIGGKSIERINSLTSATLFRKIAFEKDSKKIVVKIPLDDPKSTLFQDLPSTSWNFLARTGSEALLTIGVHPSLDDNEDTSGFSTHLKKFLQICKINRKK